MANATKANILNRVDKWWWFDAAMPKQGKKEEWRWSGESRAQQIRLESSSLLWHKVYTKNCNSCGI